MTTPHGDAGSRLGAILRDAQFWIPVVVLIGGLAVLAWIR